MMRTPSIVVTTDPRPPIRLVPPITTAAMACSSRPMPAFGSAAASLAHCDTAATALRRPDAVNAITRTGPGRTPTATPPSRWHPRQRSGVRTPCGSARPKRRDHGHRKKKRRPQPTDKRRNHRLDGASDVPGLEPVTRYAAPRATSSMPRVTMKEGSDHRVTSSPLIAPHAAPTTSAKMMAAA